MAGRTYPTQWTSLLADETTRWVQQGVIDEGQREAILSLYPAPAAGGRERTILIFTILGSLLVAAGIILFFASNWPRIPAAVKVAAILAAVVGAYGTGYFLQFRRDYPRLGHSIIFLGTLLYGGAIWLTAQIFHVDLPFGVGFLYWSLGVLPVAWSLSSLPALYLSAGTLVVWTIARLEESVSYNPLFPILMLLAVLPLARRLRSALAESVGLVGLGLWFLTNVVAHRSPEAMIAVPLLMGRLLLAYGSALLAFGAARLGDDRVYLGLGGLAALGGSYMLTFNFHLPVNQAIPGLWAEPAFAAGGFIVMVVAAAAGALLCVRRGEPQRFVLAPAVLLPALMALVAQLPGDVPRMVLFNVLLFVFTIGFIVLGLRQRSELLVNLGLGVFIIHVLTRYFDLFFTAMNKSLFFVLGGILLLAGGWLLERNRRRWMKEWGGETDEAA
jgi:uncharacterized membrane protein